MKTVVILVLDDVIAFDASTPIEVFGRVTLADGRPGYRALAAGPASEARSGPISIRVPHPLAAVETADLVIVPGRNDPTPPLPAEVVAAVRRAHAAGATIASICVGALDLAQTGLLDGRRATTHWQATSLLAERHPRVRLDAGVLYVDEGDILTSAGAAAGLDLCLHLVRRDYGAATAMATARTAVMPLTRPGGQAQLITHRVLTADEGSLAPVLAWIEQHAAERLTVAALAERAHVSTRTLTRRFHDEVGMTPVAWLTQVRLRTAQAMLEATDEPVEQVAHDTGFGTAANLRACFAGELGTSPTAYRRAFRA